MTPESRTQFEQAAKNMDWGQVVANGGPPCFHLETRLIPGREAVSRFCGRAERWQGHGVKDFHEYVSLADLWQACSSLKEKEVQTLNDMIASRDERLSCRCLFCEHGAGSGRTSGTTGGSQGGSVTVEKAKEFAKVQLRKEGDQISAFVNIPGAIVAATGDSMKDAIQILADALDENDQPFWEQGI